MSRRRAYLDDCPGERRGLIELDGRPERLLIERADDPPVQALGSRVVGRVRRIERAAGLAFVDLGEGPEGVVNLSPDAPRLVEGAMTVVEVRAQARRGKGASLRLLAEAPERLGLVETGPSLETRLRGLAVEGAELVTGAIARAAADRAQDAALAVLHALPGGGSLAIEPTRALVAVDVDLGAAEGSSAKRAARAANFAAIVQAARLLRLKGLGGLIVIDLIGRAHDAPALLAAARTAFAPDNPGVAIAPPSRFGALELTIPRRETPAVERLLDSDGSRSPRSLASDLLRALEREALAAPGARLTAHAAPEVVSQAAPFLAWLTERFGARLNLAADPALAAESCEIRVS